MRVLFCNIAWMKYYKGKFPNIDEPENGGSYVRLHNDAHEKYNFTPVEGLILQDKKEPGTYCLGFVEPKSTNGTTRNQIHLEKIDGCELCKKENMVDDVLVVYCAKHPTHNVTFVVGWYKKAKVFRCLEAIDFQNEENGEVEWQNYNALANVEDCVLMPVSTRIDMKKWRVPRKKGNVGYGFGSSNTWFAKDDNELCREFVTRIVKQIEEYDGENWIDKYPEI